MVSKYTMRASTTKVIYLELRTEQNYFESGEVTFPLNLPEKSTLEPPLDFLQNVRSRNPEEFLQLLDSEYAGLCDNIPSI